MSLHTSSSASSSARCSAPRAFAEPHRHALPRLLILAGALCCATVWAEVPEDDQAASIQATATVEPSVTLPAATASEGAGFDPQGAREQAVVGFAHLGKQEVGMAQAALAPALAQWPNHPQIAYAMALSEVALGEGDMALERLRGVVERGYWLPIAAEEGFESVRQRPAYALLLQELDALTATRIGASDEAFALEEPDLIPESVVVDAAGQRAFVSSVHRRKILVRQADGRVDTFAEDGLWAVSGLAIDAPRRILWAATSAMPNMLGFAPEDDGKTALVAFDLDRGHELMRFENRLPGHRLGDLTVAEDGTVYVSDDAAGVGNVWRTVATSTSDEATWNRRLGSETEDPKAVDPEAPGAKFSVESWQAPVGLEIISPPGFLRSPQGLALSADGRHLLVADYSYGLVGCELAGDSWFHFAEPPGVALLGIDGLNRAGDDWVAIQNGLQPQRILRLRADIEARRVVASQILAMQLPQWSEPTLGTVVGDDFLYVGNSQWDRFDAEGHLPPAQELAPPSIQRLKLGPWTPDAASPPKPEDD